MADDRVAGLKIYSLGIVIQPKVAGSDTIMVSPIEALPMDSGPIRPDSKQVKVSLPDQKGVVKNTEIQGGSTIKAKWIPFGHSNRESAPDVQPSETVILFSYADTQDFYWTTIFREPILRRQETVKYMYSNQPSGQEPYDDDSAYWVLIDTVNKSVQLHTSDNDGETCTYDITLDTKAGSLSIADNLGNSVAMDSAQGNLTITMTNEVTINAKKFTVNASEAVEVTTKSLTATSESSTETTSSKAITADQMAMNASSMKSTGGISMEGEVGIQGPVTIQGAQTNQGDLNVDGNIKATGSITP